jgi:hypothetical protein
MASRVQQGAKKLDVVCPIKFGNASKDLSISDRFLQAGHLNFLGLFARTVASLLNHVVISAASQSYSKNTFNKVFGKYTSKRVFYRTAQNIRG